MTNQLKKFHSVQTSSPEEMMYLKIEVIVENVLNTYNEQIKQIHRAINISTAAVSEQLHLELNGAFLSMVQRPTLHSFLLSCLDSELQSPPSTLQEEFGLPHTDLPLRLPIWVSLKGQQEKVREYETQKHLPEVTRKPKLLVQRQGCLNNL